MNKDLKMDRYGISKDRYRELKYFCIQYGEKKNMVNRDNGFAKGQILEDVTLIEDVINETAAGLQMRNCLLNAIANGTAYEYMDVPCGRRQFYETRRKFFYLLSQKR